MAKPKWPGWKLGQGTIQISPRSGWFGGGKSEKTTVKTLVNISGSQQKGKSFFRDTNLFCRVGPVFEEDDQLQITQGKNTSAKGVNDWHRFSWRRIHVNDLNVSKPYWKRLVSQFFFFWGRKWLSVTPQDRWKMGYCSISFQSTDFNCLAPTP